MPLIYVAAQDPGGTRLMNVGNALKTKMCT